ncbi:MAG: hypothetical protein JO024_05475, partial [Candidatus Eremiobacteraeota bacterium]|nr:hypothetical protein [Candidatus Eremiobacteraeota bacterium]
MKYIAAFGVLAIVCAPLASRAQSLSIVPRPQRVAPLRCPSPLYLSRPLRVRRDFDAAAFEEVNERWRALGIPGLIRSGGLPDITAIRGSRLGAQGYRMVVAPVAAPIRVFLVGGDNAGIFYAAMTLAQLPQRVNGRWQLPCVAIHDQPALRWRILSDDVSRGPLPTMRYFKERIRTIAAFKMNGYSPYMEHVFLDPRNPLPAPLDGITPAQFRELA